MSIFQIEIESIVATLTTIKIENYMCACLGSQTQKTNLRNSTKLGTLE